MKSILLFDGVFQYGVVNEFIDEMAQHLPELGYSPIRVNLVDGDMSPLESANFDDVLCAICFNGVGAALEYKGEYFFKKTNIPVIQILVDHPAFHAQRLTLLQNQAVSCVDNTHVEFLKGVGCPQVFLLLHGGPSESTEVLKNRPIDILFPASFSAELCSGAHWDSKYGDLVTLLYDIANETISNPLIGLEERILAHPLAVNLVDESNVSETYMQVVIDLNLYFRQRARLELATFLDKAGHKIHLCGIGWESQQFTHHEILGHCDFASTKEHMKNSKIVLDNSPFHPVGLHERCLYGAMSGAAVFTDQNPLKEQIFEQRAEAYLYSHSSLESLDEEIQNTVSQGLWENLAANGQAKVNANHTWKHRVEALISALNLNEQNRTANE